MLKHLVLALSLAVNFAAATDTQCSHVEHLDEIGQCVPNVCQCDGGEVDPYLPCYEHGAQGDCMMCNSGIPPVMNDDSLLHVCKQCECANGQVGEFSQCTAENLQGDCQSCDPGYTITNVPSEYGPSRDVCVLSCDGCLASCELADAETLQRVYSELGCGGPSPPVTHTGGAECSYSCLAAKCEHSYKLEIGYLELATKPQAC